MTVRVLRQASLTKAVPVDTLISTIEKNRDRNRTMANMVLSLSSLMISTSLAFLLYLGTNKLLNKANAMLTLFAMAILVSAAIVAIVSTLLRTQYVVSDEGQFVETLLKLLTREIRLIYTALILLLIGATLAIASIAHQALRGVMP